jgi:hypothetical protein
MNYAQASQTRLPFGPFMCETIANVGQDASGLQYLNQLHVKLMGREYRSAREQRVLSALCAYLCHPAVEARLLGKVSCR